MNGWITRAELKFGHFGIPGLLRYVAALNALSFILYKLDRRYLEFLYLDRDAILSGEVWRLVTYLFVPSMGGLIFPDWFGMAFYVVFLMWVGDGLEQAWGAFKLTLFYGLGMLGTTIAGFISNYDPSGWVLNCTLLFAFAHFYPDTIIRLMFLIPVKVKWLAWLDAVMILVQFMSGWWAVRISILVALANYFVFFGREHIQDARHRRDVTKRRARFERDIRDGAPETMHQCKVCGTTETASPELEFRVAADGEEYCLPHLPKLAP